jgi:hypothetical protein
MPLPRAAHIATVKLSAMALKYRELCIAARIAPTKNGRQSPGSSLEICPSHVILLRQISDDAQMGLPRFFSNV